MLVAIAGAGNVGLFIANELVDGGHEVLLIENNLEVVKRIPARAGITVCAADACEVSSLKEAGLELGLVDEATFDRVVRPETMIGR